MVAPSLIGVQRGLDLTWHREPWGPAPAELGTGRALPPLPARQGQAGPGRGKACAPQQAASTGLGSRQGKPGPERHSPPESGDRDRGRAGGSVPLQSKDKEDTATKPGTFIYSRVNRAGLGPNDHGARAGGIVERRRQKNGRCAPPLPGCKGQGTAPHQHRLPSLSPHREKLVTLTQLCPVTLQPNAKLMGRCAPGPGAAQTSQHPQQGFASATSCP